MNKNIWYISKYASPLKYGFASRHFYLAKEFKLMGYKTFIISSDSNHLVEFPEFRDTYTRETIDSVDTIWIRTHKYRASGGVQRIFSWIDFEWKLFRLDKKTMYSPNVIIISSLSLLTVLSGIWLKHKYKSRLIFEIRDIWPLTIIQVGGYSRLNPFILFLSWVERLGYKKADVIIGTMPNLISHVQNVIGPNNKCFNIPQGFDPSLYKNPLPLSDGYIEQSLPQRKFIVGYAGTISRSNALETLVDCAIDLKGNKSIHFALLGDGDLLERIKYKTRQLTNISFLPKVKKQQVQLVLEHFDVLYDSVKNISLYDYGLSRNKWIDYMYAGKPIIASYSGYKSMLNEADCGTFVPAENMFALKEAIIKYASLSKEELNEIGQRGKTWLIENRAFSTLAKEYIKIIT